MNDWPDLAEFALNSMPFLRNWKLLLEECRRLDEQQSLLRQVGPDISLEYSVRIVGELCGSKFLPRALANTDEVGVVHAVAYCRKGNDRISGSL